MSSPPKKKGGAPGKESATTSNGITPQAATNNRGVQAKWLIAGVKVFRNVRDRRGWHAQISAVIDLIRKPSKQLQTVTDEARRLLREKGKEAYSAYRKQHVECFTMSGRTTGASGRKAVSKGNFAHSGLLQCDIDQSANPQLRSTGEFEKLRQALSEDPCVAFFYVSLSGLGLKCAVRIDGTQHDASFATLERYMQATHGVKIDPRCKDKLRLAFISADPEIFVNERARLLPIAPHAKETSRAGAPFSPLSSTTQALEDSNHSGHSHHSNPLQDSKTTQQGEPTTPRDQQPTTQQLAARLEGRRLKLQFQKDDPKLFDLYETLVERAHPPEPGTRNQTLVRVVTLLFHSVGAKLLKDLMHKFYVFRAGYYHDPLHEHMQQVEAHRRTVEANYPATLAPIERDFYATYGLRQQEAFRILRDLSLFSGLGSLPPPLFHCSQEHLALRLSIEPEQARRILSAFLRDGILTVHEPGRPRAAGQSGRATVYRWLL